MKAVTYRAGDGVHVEDIEVTVPGRGLVAVDIKATGVCHSDLHIVNGDWPADRPLVLGHEGAGVVTAVGEGVSELAVDDHVVLSWFAPCRRCRNCAAVWKRPGPAMNPRIPAPGEAPPHPLTSQSRGPC